MNDVATKKGFLQDLWDRRFFQFIGSYLAVSFGILQFCQFLENRYDLQVMLVEKLLLFLIILFPAFVIFIYNHGRPGDEKWLPYEKILVPGSLSVGLVTSIFLFNSPMQAATEVTITTEEGTETTRMVPALSSNNRLVVFPFETQGNTEDDEWKRVGGSYLLDKDLEQDMRIIATQALSLKYFYESYNQRYLSQIPFSTQLKIARDLYTDYFVISSLMPDNSWTFKIYDSENGELVHEGAGEGESFFAVIDQMSDDLNAFLYTKESGRSLDIVDLPASNLVSQNEQSFRLFIEAAIRRESDVNQAQAAIEQIREAASLDPGCAECLFYLARLYSESGNIDEAKKYIDEALAMSSTLPERQQFMITAMKYNLNQENDKVINLLENWRKLYPSDSNPYQKLITFYEMSFQIDKAKEVGETAIGNGHRGSLLSTLANLYIKTEDFAKAEKYLNEFSRLYPHKSKERALLGDIYIAQGELGEAMSLYEDIDLLNPNDVKNTIRIANIQERLGEFDKALKTYKDALTKSNQVQDSMEVYTAIETFYDRLGQFSTSREYANKREQLFLKLAPLPVVRQNMFFTTDIKYLFYGKEEQFMENMTELKKMMPGSESIIDCVGGFMYDMFLENKEKLESLDPQCMAILIQSVGESWKHLIDGAIARLDGRYEDAIKNYESYIELTGAAAKAFSYQLSEVYRKGGQIKKADELMDKLLREDPHQAVFLAEKAKIAMARNNIPEARKYYDKAMVIWSDSDPGYFLFLQAQELGKSINEAEES